jgi:hypothetical protein
MGKTITLREQIKHIESCNKGLIKNYKARLLQEGTSKMYWLAGFDETGREAHYYFLPNKLKLPIFLNLVRANSPLNLNLYGRVVDAFYC